MTSTLNPAKNLVQHRFNVLTCLLNSYNVKIIILAFKWNITTKKNSSFSGLLFAAMASSKVNYICFIIEAQIYFMKMVLFFLFFF